MKEINVEEAKKLELDILLAFSEFCKSHNLKYFLAYGTLIGAVRHKGFIPWDDDIDIIMPRPDYEKFIELTGFNPINEIYETRLYDHTQNKSVYEFAKIVDNRTIVFEKGKNKRNQSAVWIDIFPLDGAPETEAETKKVFKKIHNLRNMLDLAVTNPFVNPQSFIKKLIKSAVRLFLIPLGPKFFCKKINKIAKSFSYENSKFVSVMVWQLNDHDKMPSEVFKEEIDVIFEGYKFKAPKKYDEYLKSLYGDYMKLPPESERIPHGFTAYYL